MRLELRLVQSLHYSHQLLVLDAMYKVTEIYLAWNVHLDLLDPNISWISIFLFYFGKKCPRR